MRQAGFFQRFFGSTKRFFNIPVRVALAACCAQGDCRWDLPPPTVLRLFHWRSLCLFGGRPVAGNRWPRSRGELVHFFSKRRARAPMAPTKASARAPRARGFWDARAPRLHNKCRKHFFGSGPSGPSHRVAPDVSHSCLQVLAPKKSFGACIFFRFGILVPFLLPPTKYHERTLSHKRSGHLGPESLSCLGAIAICSPESCSRLCAVDIQAPLVM